MTTDLPGDDSANNETQQLSRASTHSQDTRSIVHAEPWPTVAAAHESVPNSAHDRFATEDFHQRNTAGGPIPNTNASADVKLRYFGDYELLSEIARGGMGVVYKARQVNLNRIVALKMILSGQLASTEDVQRFHAEAEAAANLDHPGIVPIFEIGHEDGQHYFSMGYVNGSSLAERIKDGPLPPREAAELTKKIADAIAYAHDKRVIHRDLKPANVLLDKNGEPKVTDFGLARKLEQDSGMTKTGAVMGTPSYMPPEQAAGRTDEVGTLSDVYSIGAILYCLLTGRPPFQAASSVDTILQVLEREPVSVTSLNPGVPRDLETICQKCLQKEPTKRYTSATKLAEDIVRWLRGEPIQARAVSKTERAWRWGKRNPVITTSLLFAIMAISSGTSISTYFALHASRKALESDLARQHSNRRLYAAQVSSAFRYWQDGQAREASNILTNIPYSGFESELVSALSARSQVMFRTNADASREKIAFNVTANLLAICRGREIIFHSLDTNKVLATSALAENESVELAGIRFSGDGRRLFVRTEVETKKLLKTANRSESFSISERSGVTVIDCNSGNVSSTIKEFANEQFHKWTVSPDGRSMFVATPIRSTIFDVERNDIVCVMPDPGDLPGAFAPNGLTFARAFYREGKSSIEVRDCNTWEVTQKIQDLPGRISAIAWSNDGLELFAACDGCILKWRNRGSSFEEPMIFPVHGSSCSSINVSPDGSSLVAVYDYTDDCSFVQLPPELDGKSYKSRDWGRITHRAGHHSPVVFAEFTADSRFILSGDKSNEIRISPVDQHPLQFKTSARNSSFLGDGAVLIVNNSIVDPHLRILSADNDTTRSFQTIPIVTNANREMHEGPFSPDFIVGLSNRSTQCVLLAAESNSVTISANGSSKVFEHPGYIISLDPVTGEYHQERKGIDQIDCYAISADRKKAAFIADRRILIWDATSADFIVDKILDNYSTCYSASFSHDGKRIWMASFGEKQLKCFSLETKSTTSLDLSGLLSLPSERTVDTRVACHPVDNVIAVSIGRRIYILTREDRGSPVSLPSLAQNVTYLAFSPDGKCFVSGCEDGSVTFWDLTIGEPTLTLRQQSKENFDIRFSDDGQQLAVTTDGANASTVIWDSRKLIGH